MCDVPTLKTACLLFFLVCGGCAKLLVEPPPYYDVAGTPGVQAETFRDPLRSGGRGPEMVSLPAGTFQMGCVSGLDCEDVGESLQQVTLSEGFAVGKYEVTFAEWDACVAAGGCAHRSGDEGWGRDRRPVINVTWADAKEYVDWLSSETGAEYRLMSESEWEYSARAGSSTAYGWGNEVGSARANCWGCGSEWDYRQTAPVGSFSPNTWGLHDMHGNVSEWVEDCWNDTYAGSPSDGSAWQPDDCFLRVVRGGSWDSLECDRGDDVVLVRPIDTGKTPVV